MINFYLLKSLTLSLRSCSFKSFVKLSGKLYRYDTMTSVFKTITLKHVKNIFTLSFIVLNLAACGSDNKKKSTEEEVVSTPTKTSILISSGDGNHRGITSYNIDGSFENAIIDLRAFGSNPMGLAIGGNGSFLTSTNGADSILEIPYDNTYEFFYGSAVFNGNVYDIEYGPTLDYYYAVESANIEVFSSAGDRLSTAIIPNNLAPCNLGAPRNMHATDDGFLYVADYNNNRIHKFDVSNHTPTCVDSFDVSGLRPYGVIVHSNELIYFTSWTDDAVYTLDEGTLTLTNIFEPGLTILRDPTAIAELPDGTIMAASSITDSIELIDEAGVRQGVAPFIQDIYSLNITDIEVLTREL